MRRPILFSIPHGGQLVPEELKQSSALSPIDILEDSDPFTDRFYDLTSEGFIVVKATIARAFVDLNRADNDLPPQNPDGVIKSHTCYNVPVYLENQIPKGGFLTRILTKYYHSYHEKIHELCQNGNFLLGLDCHSMASSPPGTLVHVGEQKTDQVRLNSISYDTDNMNEITQFDIQEIEEQEDPVPVRVIGYGDFSVNLRAWVWVKDPGTSYLMECELNEKIKARFDAEGIEIPFPYRTIVMKEKPKRRGKK